MLEVFEPIPTKDKNSLLINNDELTDPRPEYLVHQPHERTGCVRQPKRHHQPLVQAVFGVESLFPFLPVGFDAATTSTDFSK